MVVTNNVYISFDHGSFFDILKKNIKKKEQKNTNTTVNLALLKHDYYYYFFIYVIYVHAYVVCTYIRFPYNMYTWYVYTLLLRNELCTIYIFRRN